jgi:hypothetical protein
VPETDIVALASVDPTMWMKLPRFDGRVAA